MFFSRANNNYPKGKRALWTLFVNCHMIRKPILDGNEWYLMALLWKKIIPICFFIFQGLFNVSDKLMVSFDILLEIREFLKTGHPLNNVISAKLNILKMKTVKVIFLIWNIFILPVTAWNN